MRNVSKPEIAEYLRWAYADKAAANFTQDQAFVIGEAAKESPLFRTFAAKALEADMRGIGMDDYLLSLWVMAFQMGREFELKNKPS